MINLRGKQQEVLNLPYDGHNVVLGVAGSGKSVCAVYRASYLDKVTKEPVLLLSYNNSLVNYLDDVSEGLLNNVNLKTFHKFAIEYLKSFGLLGYNQIVSNDWKKEKLIMDAISSVVSRIGVNSTLDRTEFIIEEIKWMQRIGALQRDEYENIERIGRGDSRLLKENRKYIFDVFEEYMRLRALQGYRYDWDDIAYYFYKDAEDRTFKPQYKHILIDEGQDFSPAMIKSIVNYSQNNGSIIFFGDSAQQIYGNKISWRKSGLQIRKVYNLDENHRNTAQIERLANEIRKSMNLSDEEITLNTKSLSNGELPNLYKFSSQSQEISFAVKKSRELSKNESVAVIFRTNRDISDFCDTLIKENISFVRVDREAKGYQKNKGVFVGTYYSMKGLEFDSVIIPYCTNDKLFDESRLKALESEAEMNIEIAKLLYVAVTRAKRRLYITYSNEIASIFPHTKNLVNLISDGD